MHPLWRLCAAESDDEGVRYPRADTPDRLVRKPPNPTEEASTLVAKAQRPATLQTAM
ncbi:MAG TPA: hypothetical protein VE999_17030 [Gemmataceae bacterium]|nr:hypothetical protein [Gemmataceae bacterium]